MRRVRRHRIWLWLAAPLCAVGSLAAASRLLSEQYVIELGPFSLPANSTHGDHEQPALLALESPVDGWLRGMAFELIDQRGERLPSQLLHHLNLITPEHRELFSQIMLRLGAAGPETQPYALPFFLGYRLRPGDSLLVSAMLHNPTPRALEGVRLRARLQLTRVTPWFRPIAIQPMYVDVMPPAGAHSFDLPPGRSVKVWEGQPAIPARLLAAGGHLHQYATALRFEDVSTGETIWNAHPRLGKDGEVLSMPIRYFPPFGVRLQPGHRYRLTAEYDNPTGKVLASGGMGALGGVVVPAGAAIWPTVNRDNAEYIHDVSVITGPAIPHRHQAAEWKPISPGSPATSAAD